jgi:UPF0271 protein
MQPTIDLNADAGESFGAWTMGDDAGLMRRITSVNIACGFHAGDPIVMRDTLALAARHGVAVGAHVSYPDLRGFGRHALQLPPEQVHADCLYQIGALAALAHAQGLRLTHVKPHGALYNQAARDRRLADAIAAAVAAADPALRLVGLAGGVLLAAGRAHGLAVLAEGFVDRSYEADGSLTPRSLPDAVHADLATACAQAVAIARGEPIVARGGARLHVAADTLCLHGDRADAAAAADAVHAALAAAGVRIRAPESCA